MAFPRAVPFQWYSGRSLELLYCKDYLEKYSIDFTWIFVILKIVSDFSVFVLTGEKFGETIAVAVALFSVHTPIKQTSGRVCGKGITHMQKIRNAEFTSTVVHSSCIIDKKMFARGPFYSWTKNKIFLTDFQMEGVIRNLFGSTGWLY